MTWFEFLLGKNLDMLTVHGRTRKEMSKVPAHWDLIGQVREMRDKLAPQTLVVGNGDVGSHQQGLELAQQYGLDGIMVGRGIFKDPFVFSEAGPEDWEHTEMKYKIRLYLKHVEFFDKTWQPGQRPVHTLNKFCKMYIQGFDGAKELRDQLMRANSTLELIQILQKNLT